MTETTWLSASLLNAVFVYSLVLSRVGVFLAFVPGVFSSLVPARVRGALILGICAIVALSLPMSSQDADYEDFFDIMFREILIGLVFGLVLRILVLSLNTAGSISSQATSLMQIFGAANMDPLPALGYLLVLGGLCLCAVLGLHLDLLSLLVLSYTALPVGSVMASDSALQSAVGAVSYSFLFAFTAAAPFILVSIIYNVLIGFVNRAMPQLMVAFIGAPVITLLGLYVLFKTAPFVIEKWFDTVSLYFASLVNG